MARWMAGLALAALVARQAAGLLLSEVLANPAGSEYEDEFIELVQDDSLSMELAGLRVSDGSGVDVLQSWDGGPTRVGPGGLALVLDPGHQGVYLDGLPAGVVLLTVGDGALGSGGLSNSSPEEIRLEDGAGNLLDRVWTRPELPEGFSLERREGGADCDSCWRTARWVQGTPGRPNSVRRLPGEVEWTFLDGRPCLRAVGAEGFQGRWMWTCGLGVCLDSLWNSLHLSAGASVECPWPDPPLPGWNPCRLSVQGAGAPQLLLDTLLWRDPRPGELHIEALAVAEPDWLQLRAGPCPALLDGLRLSGRSFSLALADTLPAGGVLLLGSPAAGTGCAPDLRDTRGLSLPLAGAVDLWGPESRRLDSAGWPPHEGQTGPWRRLDPARPGEDGANWAQDLALEPGCRPSAPPAADRPAAGWRMSGLQLDSAGETWLSIEADGAVGRPWRLQVWTLEGTRLRDERVPAERLVWNGMDSGGRPLPAGLHVLRLSGAGREYCTPIEVRPAH